MFYDETINFSRPGGVNGVEGLVTLTGYHAGENGLEETSILVNSFDFGTAMGGEATTSTVTEAASWHNLFTENEVTEAHEEIKRDVQMININSIIKMEPAAERDDDEDEKQLVSLSSHFRNGASSSFVSDPFRPPGQDLCATADLMHGVKMKIEEDEMRGCDRRRPSSQQQSQQVCSFPIAPLPPPHNQQLFNAADYVFNLGDETSGQGSMFVVASNSVLPENHHASSSSNSPSTSSSSASSSSSNPTLDYSSLFEGSFPNIDDLDLNIMLRDLNPDPSEVMYLFGRGDDTSSQIGSSSEVSGLLDDVSRLPIQNGGGGDDPFIDLVLPCDRMPSFVFEGSSDGRAANSSSSSSSNVVEDGASSNTTYEISNAAERQGRGEQPDDDGGGSSKSSGSPAKRKCYQRKQRMSSSSSRASASQGKKQSTTFRSKNGSKKGKKQPNQVVKKSFAVQKQPAKRKRVSRNDTTTRQPSSFRVEMGAHLRTISAVLDLSGIKHDSDSEIVPYEVLKRFKPVDVFRTLHKSTGTKDSSKEPAGKPSNPFSENYDWSQWNRSPYFFSHDDHPLISDDEDSSDVNHLIYYSSHAKPQEGKFDPVVSVFPKYEVDGRPNYSPKELGSLGSAELNVQLDLEKLAKECSNSEFLQDGRPLLIRLRQPKCCGLVFPTGKLLVLGSKCYNDFRVASRKFARMVQKAGNAVSLTKLSIHFYMGLCKLPFRIDLGAMVRHPGLRHLVAWDFEVFPGVIIDVRVTSVLCLVFDSGTVIFTNAAKRKDLKKTLDLIYPCVRSFGCVY